MNISFIGYGNMAKAIARGLNQESAYSLSAAAPSLTVGINKDNVRTHHDNREVASNAEIIVLAVKPAKMNEVLQEITPFIPDHCLLISVAAGLSLSWFAKHCKAKQPVIRTMPNTPASVGLAAVPMIANEYTSAEQKRQAEIIFSKIGITTWANNEEEMDTFTALSGSGPAYVFSFIDAMIQSAVALGLNESIAKTFALQTVHGALKLAQNDDLGLIELKTKVTSPGGTTAAALSILDAHLHALLLASMNAAKQRAHELGTIQ
ncbi:pyrroline-5-carboxylate reductase [Legionella fallonii]|uniref:Pyrroline-5-carboxylate reductase n=1 Tax=Legionella fallonii LLAP-10 TaxID=1212491 RepID=A0A098G544_9GAMM|nr:pyrroline-5-carboxylate reductase [Legionella fallonii]CEG57592.1 Pyrroline-5-carboxylate reductase (P5CR) (P5C reductase) [Legionella fallonii LLAP-10]